MLEKSIGRWRAPVGHLTPGAGRGEIILFKSFIERGLGLPSSKIFRGLLHFYGLTVNHLTPNGVLHISIFVHLCEAFLGICPSLDLFRYFLWVKCQPSDIAATVDGGAGVQLRIDTKKQYLEYDLIEPVKDWANGWFYMENHPPILAKHTGFAPRKQSNWVDRLNETEIEQIQPLLSQLHGLKDSGLTGAEVLRSFTSRRIQPLMQHVNFGFEYLGLKDPSRMSSEELPAKEVLKHLRQAHDE